MLKHRPNFYFQLQFIFRWFCVWYGMVINLKPKMEFNCCLSRGEKWHIWSTHPPVCLHFSSNWLHSSLLLHWLMQFPKFWGLLFLALCTAGSGIVQLASPDRSCSCDLRDVFVTSSLLKDFSWRLFNSFSMSSTLFWISLLSNFFSFIVSSM